MSSDKIAPRLVMPRRRMIAGSMVAIGALAGHPGFAQSGEGGEGGEGAAGAGLAEPVALLVELGLYEASVRIVAALVSEGAPDTAREHLEESHHADHESLEEDLAAAGAAPFEDQAEAFGATLNGAADPAAVAAAAEALLAAVAAAHGSAGAADEMAAVETLRRTAYEDFEAGVADGKVTAPQEYRDAWSFVEVARARLALLAASPDTAVAEAAAARPAALDPVAALFPGLAATEVPGADPSAIAGAAARVELAALRLK